MIIDNAEVIYLTLCNENMEAERDSSHESVEDEKKRVVEVNRNVVWED